MRLSRILIAAASLPALAFAAACTPAENERTADVADAAAPSETRTVVETREVAVPTPPVVVEREVAVPTPPVEAQRVPAGDTTTVRAGRDGIEVETTNR